MGQQQYNQPQFPTQTQPRMQSQTQGMGAQGNIVGSWQHSQPGLEISYSFTADGKYSVDYTMNGQKSGSTGSYQMGNGVLVVTNDYTGEQGSIPFRWVNQSSFEITIEGMPLQFQRVGGMQQQPQQQSQRPSFNIPGAGTGGGQQNQGTPSLVGAWSFSQQGIQIQYQFTADSRYIVNYVVQGQQQSSTGTYQLGNNVLNVRNDQTGQSAQVPFRWIDQNTFEMTIENTPVQFTRSGGAQQPGGFAQIPGQQQPQQQGNVAQQQPDAQQQPGAAESRERVGAGWTTYRHPLGLTFTIPEGWQVAEIDDGLQMTPPDAATEGGQPVEIYMILASPAEGITSPADPQVGQFLDSALRNYFPFLQSGGNPQQMNVGGSPGALYTWSGKNQAGKDVLARSYVVILQNYALSLIGLGYSQNLQARTTVLDQMFVSFSIGQRQIDPQIVGRWTMKSEHSTSYSHAVDTYVLDLNNDGSMIQRSSTFMSITGMEATGGTYTDLADTGTDVDGRGTWSVGNNNLYLLWDDGDISVFQYNLSFGEQGRVLVMQGHKEKPKYWYEYQPE
jgi:hypothetical protein